MLARLKQRIPDARNDALLEEMLAGAAEMICAYTARSTLPEALKGAQLELAAAMYNRMGMEGESAHAEGSMHCSIESLPELIRRQINPWRLARTVETCV